MLLRLLSLAMLAVLSAPSGTMAQPSLLNGSSNRGVDVLTGEPVGPRGERPRREPELLNAPRAPGLGRGRGVEGPPLEVYALPQVGSPYGIQTVPQDRVQRRAQYENEVKPQYGSQFRSQYGGPYGSPNGVPYEPAYGSGYGAPYGGAPYGGPYGAQGGRYAPGLLPR